MITINKESYKACQSELEPLFLEQYAENEPDLGYELDPDYERYVELDDLGWIHTYVARDKGTIVGYLVIVLDWHFHHMTKMYAHSDIIYVHPEYRGGSVARELIKTAGKNLKERGIDRFVITMKIKQQFRSLLAGLDFQPSEELWERKL